jgi:hypothetical protein
MHKLRHGFQCAECQKTKICPLNFEKIMPLSVIGIGRKAL